MNICTLDVSLMQYRDFVYFSLRKLVFMYNMCIKMYIDLKHIYKRVLNVFILTPVFIMVSYI